MEKRRHENYICSFNFFEKCIYKVFFIARFLGALTSPTIDQWKCENIGMNVYCVMISMFVCVHVLSHTKHNISIVSLKTPKGCLCNLSVYPIYSTKHQCITTWHLIIFKNNLKNLIFCLMCFFCYCFYLILVLVWYWFAFSSFHFFLLLLLVL